MKLGRFNVTLLSDLTTPVKWLYGSTCKHSSQFDDLQDMLCDQIFLLTFLVNSVKIDQITIIEEDFCEIHLKYYYQSSQKNCTVDYPGNIHSSWFFVHSLYVATCINITTDRTFQLHLLISNRCINDVYTLAGRTRHNGSVLSCRHGVIYNILLDIKAKKLNEMLLYELGLLGRYHVEAVHG